VDRLVDLIVPIGAILVICFSIGSIFYDGTSHFSSPPSLHVLKAYRKDVSVAVP